MVPPFTAAMLTSSHAHLKGAAVTERPSLSRRHFLASTGAAAGLVALPQAVTTLWRPATSAAADTYPFTLGVASGDPLPDAVVIWTRLAPQPLERAGGMTDEPVPVRWEVSATEDFRRPLRRGTTLAVAAEAHTVHVDVRGLDPHTWYWYRFQAQGEVSAVGRTRTAPARGSIAPVAFAFASCAQYEHGWFTAYRRIAEEDLDVVFHLGDYVYEFAGGDYQAPAGNVRTHAGGELVTLDDYRRRYAQYSTDADLQAAHAAAPWIVTWDDHEVDNNYAAAVPEFTDAAQGNGDEASFLARRAAAYQAYWEHMPLRPENRAVGPDLQLYRGFTYGDTASFSVLDTRQYRTDQPCGDPGPAAGCGEESDPQATLLGQVQAGWLEDRLAASAATWNVLPQQVFMAGTDAEPGGALPDDPRDAGGSDSWDGYRASRHRLLDFVAGRGIENLVVLTGDVHNHCLADLRRDFEDEMSPVLGTELVCTSIASGGDGTDRSAGFERLLPENPHLRYNSNRRGYVSCRADRETLRAEFRVLDHVSTPGAPVRTDAAFVIEAGTARAEPA
ncbi:alkaline phosphatase D [Jiangella alkaliphila]|uniref:Alkaline phosphatase D n=1 Tax=Jiangella alkaliphila TaxID=419479 RepID=A0A1H2J947_9ACTN|nr:alkaline phosphatase D [Jiangella alkaliphila]